MNQLITINSSKVCNFFAAHPHLDPTVFVENCVDMFYALTNGDVEKSTADRFFFHLEKNESQTRESINDLKKSITGCISSHPMLTDIRDRIERFSGSSVESGKAGERFLENILNDRYKSREVTNLSKDANHCDLKLVSPDGFAILFETKNYKAKVNSREVEKFIRDIQLQCLPGIFLSQKSEIALKENLRLEMIRCDNGQLLPVVYVTNWANNQSSIDIAVSCVENVCKFLSFHFGGSDNVDVSKEELRLLVQDIESRHASARATYESFKVYAAQHLKALKKQAEDPWQFGPILSRNGHHLDTIWKESPSKKIKTSSSKVASPKAPTLTRTKNSPSTRVKKASNSKKCDGDNTQCLKSQLERSISPSLSDSCNEIESPDRPAMQRQAPVQFQSAVKSAKAMHFAQSNIPYSQAPYLPSYSGFQPLNKMN